jgi:cell division protein FtsB
VGGRRPCGANLSAGMAKRRIKQRKRIPRGRFLVRWLILAVFGFVAFLYYQPLQSYRDTRDAVEQRSAEVESLRAEKRSLERRLVEAETPEALAREARRLGYVKPGERLFIVKGIDAWRRAQALKAKQTDRR